MHDAVIRGDFCNISINRYCFIDDGAVIEPSSMPPTTDTTTSSVEAKEEEARDENATYVPMHIGKYSHIGKQSHVQAASIGLGCYIGDHCVVSNRAILKDHVRVEDGSVVPADFVAPPFAILAGKCGKLRIVGDVS